MGKGNSEPLGLRRAQDPLSQFLGECFNLGLLQEQRALPLLPPPWQLHLKEESNYGCILEGCDLVSEREVCSQSFSRIGSLRGLWCHLALPCWIPLGLPKPSQAHDELKHLQGEMVERGAWGLWFFWVLKFPQVFSVRCHQQSLRFFRKGSFHGAL